MTVDILFPFYGDVAMMKEAVRSVLRQTNPDWRLIVVDDGYPDDSIPGWFDSLEDSRVTYMRNETNLGANGNYRKCLTFVENPLVQVMGADDVMLPNYVDWLGKAAHRPPFSMPAAQPNGWGPGRQISLLKGRQKHRRRTPGRRWPQPFY